MTRPKQITGLHQRDKDSEPEAAASLADDLQERERQFKSENAAAFASMNAWVEEHGLPLAKFRQF